MNSDPQPTRPHGPGALEDSWEGQARQEGACTGGWVVSLVSQGEMLNCTEVQAMKHFSEAKLGLIPWQCLSFGTMINMDA
jgi:hypothetical protein